MRWWWFGPSVTKPELERELRVMKSAGIGGVEIQPVYPVALDDPQKQFHNFAYLSDEFLGDLRFTSQLAKQLGLRVDVTLGSGWPYGGPRTPVTEAAGRLRCERVVVPENADSVVVPALENGENLIAAFAANGTLQTFSLDGTKQLTDFQNGRLRLPEMTGPHVVLFFISSRTGQQVKRPSVGAEGFVLNHYDRSAVEHHLSAVANRLMQAFGENPPHAVFSDSLEVYGSDWTNDFLKEFARRRGYDLTPHLPALALPGPVDDETRSIRHDWGKTLTELAEERYLTPVREWAHAHHTLFRSQTYGIPPVILSSNALVDLPEGEHGPEWRGFSAARWASSAGHLYGRPVISTETWTWLHAPAFRATPLDMKAEADLHFTEGINQLVGHGWPYSPPFAGEPGWRFYAAAAFNDHNPWFQVMPEITRYLQRISFLMRRGAPANDIAIYLPTDDAWADFKLGDVSVDERMQALFGPALIPQILDSGYNFDFIDDRALAAAGLPYKAVILPGVERIPLATLERLRKYEQQGGFLVATRRLPSLAPGFTDASETPRIQTLVHQLFEAGNKNARFVGVEQSLGSTLNQMVAPDFSTGAAASAIAFVHRKLPWGDIYFVVNTSNDPIETHATARVSESGCESWDPFTGEVDSVSNRGPNVELQLAPYESKVLVFSNHAGHGSMPATVLQSSIDLSSNWTVHFAGTHQTVAMPQLRSWTDDPSTHFYSGLATYEKTIQLPASLLRPPSRSFLDFGPGERVPPVTGTHLGMRALLESPVRESALVYINGDLAGTVWRPPYEVDVTRFLRTGQNEIRILVANLAINEMAGQALPDYKLLNLRYGQRFTPQGFENLVPLPSGILGGVRLIAR